MHCPMCGNKMEQVKGHTEEDSLRGARSVTDYERVDESVHWYCPVLQCFGEDFPLRQHHPFKGWESPPGDSWSLSWIK